MGKKISYLNNKERKVIESFVKELRKKLGDDIVFIRLFGSKAKGNFKEDSDIDIFVLVKEKTLKVEDTIAEIEVDYDIKYNLPISTVLYSIFEYKKNKELDSFFIENVEKEGIAL